MLRFDRPSRSFIPPILLVALCLGGLSACQGNYRYILNDNVLYGPGSDTSTTTLGDAALQACLNQQQQNSENKEVDQVKTLTCAGAGVKSLGGIGKLVNLEQLELSDNSISDLRPLAPLKHLRMVGLRNNPVATVAPLLGLQFLRVVNLQGVPDLDCREVAPLRKRLGNTLSLPAHCRE